MAKGKFEPWLTADGLLKLEAWARNGLTDEQIAHNMGIRRSTLNEWKNRFPVIMDTLKKGKEVVDIMVENALLKRALGYTFTEITKERIAIINEQSGTIEGHEMKVTKEVTKEVQPDTTAQIFWLKNRKPQDWRDRKEIGVDGSIETQNNPYAGLTAEDLKKLIKDG
jgi:transcriptional regulator with XRE-family HTH domain